MQLRFMRKKFSLKYYRHIPTGDIVKVEPTKFYKQGFDVYKNYWNKWHYHSTLIDMMPCFWQEITNEEAFIEIL